MIAISSVVFEDIVTTISRSLAGADLDRLVTWLLQQCGSPETECRQQCISLFKQFSPLQKSKCNVQFYDVSEY